MKPAAPLIALLLCDRCGHSPLPPQRPHDAVCTCIGWRAAALAQDVDRRYRDAAQRAHRHDDWRRRYPAWSNR